MQLGSKKNKQKKNTGMIFSLVECDDWLFVHVCVKLVGVGLNVFELAGKVECHPGGCVSIFFFYHFRVYTKMEGFYHLNVNVYLGIDKGEGSN